MEGGNIYPSNTKMSDFKRQMILFVHNFVPSNDESISPNWFFTLGKMGKPNQVSWMMPFLVLGKCTWRYSLSKFDDVDSAMRININRTIFSNHGKLFVGKRQAHWQHCVLQQTGSVDRSNLWKKYERLCAKILEEGGNYRIIIIGKHAWDACRERFPEEKILNQRNTPHGSCIRRNNHFKSECDSFFIHIGCWCCISFRQKSDTISDSERGTLLHRLCLLKELAARGLDELSSIHILTDRWTDKSTN